MFNKVKGGDHLGFFWEGAFIFSCKQCCRSESERIRAFFAESEIFVPDSDSDPVPNTSVAEP